MKPGKDAGSKAIKYCQMLHNANELDWKRLKTPAIHEATFMDDDEAEQQASKKRKPTVTFSGTKVPNPFEI